MRSFHPSRAELDIEAGAVQVGHSPRRLPSATLSPRAGTAFRALLVCCFSSPTSPSSLSYPPDLFRFRAGRQRPPPRGCGSSASLPPALSPLGAVLSDEDAATLTSLSLPILPSEFLFAFFHFRGASAITGSRAAASFFRRACRFARDASCTQRTHAEHARLFTPLLAGPTQHAQ